MAAELVLLILNRKEFTALRRKALKGDPDATETIAALWDDHLDKEIYRRSTREIRRC